MMAGYWLTAGFLPTLLPVAYAVSVNGHFSRQVDQPSARLGTPALELCSQFVAFEPQSQLLYRLPAPEHLAARRQRGHTRSFRVKSRNIGGGWRWKDSADSIRPAPAPPWRRRSDFSHPPAPSHCHLNVGGFSRAFQGKIRPEERGFSSVIA